MSEKHPVKINDRDYTVVKFSKGGEYNYKQSISNEEQERLIQETYQFREGDSPVFAKLHYEPDNLHVDFEDQKGNKVEVIPPEDFAATISQVVSSTHPVSVPIPEEADDYRIGVRGDSPPGTIRADVCGEKLEMQFNEGGTVSVAFWNKEDLDTNYI